MFLAHILGPRSRMSIVSGTGGSPFFGQGYHTTQSGGYGTLSPSGFTIADTSILGIYSYNDFDLVVELADDTLIQSDWSTIVIQDSTGAWVSYATADASFATGTGLAQWSWGTGTNEVFNGSNTHFFVAG